MAHMMAKAPVAAIALLFAANALATGLGEAAGRAILGQPLRLEIPVLGSGATIPAKTCFRLQAPRADVGNEFAARNAHLEVVSQGSSTKLLITTTTAVTEPVIGFAVVAGCDIGLSRDYVLLVGLPSTAASPVIDAPHTAAPAQPVQSTKTPPADKRAVAADMLRIAAPVTLEALAQQKYPLQPKAREKFVRMMAAANPDVVSSEAPIAAGTELRLPSGLPQRRVGPYRGEAKAAAQEAPSEEATPAPAKSAHAAKRGKDRLVLGTAPESNESKLLAEAERLTGLLVEQNKTQEALTENIAKIEASYTDLRQHFLDMQTKLARVEAEQAAEKRAAENAKSAQVVELLLAVLAGGAIGGMALRLFQQRMRRSETAAVDDIAEDHWAAPLPASAHQAPMTPPWLAKAAPAAAETTIIPAAAPSEAAPSAVAAAASPSPASAVATPPAPDLPVKAVVQAEAAAEIPAAQPEVQAAAAEPARVVEPLDFAPVSLTAQETTLAPVPAASAAKEEVAQEALTLDFPEISIPAAEHGETLDFRKP